MFRRCDSSARIGMFLVALTCVNAYAPAVRADDDDVISLSGVSPEMLGALGGSMPPEMLAALLAAMNGSRAAQTGHGGASAVTIPGLPNASGAGAGAIDPSMLTTLMQGMDIPAATGASGSGGGVGGSSGGIVDVHHPGAPVDASSGPRHVPERIGRGRGGGLVELHPAADETSAAMTDPAIEPAVVAPATAIAPLRVDAARRRRARTATHPAAVRRR